MWTRSLLYFQNTRALQTDDSSWWCDASAFIFLFLFTALNKDSPHLTASHWYWQSWQLRFHWSRLAQCDIQYTCRHNCCCCSSRCTGSKVTLNVTCIQNYYHFNLCFSKHSEKTLVAWKEFLFYSIHPLHSNSHTLWISKFSLQKHFGFSVRQTVTWWLLLNI